MDQKLLSLEGLSSSSPFKNLTAEILDMLGAPNYCRELVLDVRKGCKYFENRARMSGGQSVDFLITRKKDVCQLSPSFVESTSYNWIVCRLLDHFVSTAWAKENCIEPRTVPSPEAATKPTSIETLKTSKLETTVLTSVQGRVCRLK